jgi:hypothetical protein
MEYRNLVEHLAGFYGVHPKQMTTFKSRLHVFRKYGILKLPEVGKGGRSAFGLNNLTECHLAIALQTIGLTPMRIFEVVQGIRDVPDWWPFTQWTDHHLLVVRAKGQQKLAIESLENADGLRRIISDLPGWCMVVDLRPIARDLRLLRH